MVPPRNTGLSFQVELRIPKRLGVHGNPIGPTPETGSRPTKKTTSHTYRTPAKETTIRDCNPSAAERSPGLE